MATNLKKMALRRIQRELKDMSDVGLSCTAHPVGDDLFNWEGTINGPLDSPFEVRDVFFCGRLVMCPSKDGHFVRRVPRGLSGVAHD